MKIESNIRVMLADDHPVVMQGFALSLEDFNVEIVAKAADVDRTFEVFTELLPSVLVLDIRFGNSMSGIDLAKKILSKHPGAKIVFLSQFDQPALIREAYRLGAKAFITKNCSPAELAEAINKAHAGEVYFMPHVAELLANVAIEAAGSPQAILEPRELEIFSLMAKGMTNVEIAAKLSLSAKTISNTSQSIKDKLGIHRQADITLLAVKWSIIAPT